MTSVTDDTDGSQANQEVKASTPHGSSRDPKGFFLGVMNDKKIELHLRVEAAKALLPYCEGRIGGKAGWRSADTVYGRLSRLIDMVFQVNTGFRPLWRALHSAESL